jgi:predicted transcriptional regulator
MFLDVQDQTKTASELRGSTDSEVVISCLSDWFKDHSKDSAQETSSSLATAMFSRPSRAPVGRDASGESFGKIISEAYAERRLRDKIFGDGSLFGEPAWDILLDIANAEVAGKRLSVTSVCIGACVPATTALRWLKILETKGLIFREGDGADARRSYVRLTATGYMKIELYCKGVRIARTK